MYEQQFPWARIYSLGSPLEISELSEILEDIRVNGPQADNNNLSQQCRLTGDSAPMQQVKELCDRVAPSTATVLITGESGTGKEVVARRIHEQSGRSGAFVAINCGAIPDHLLESELFGHEKGAFTGASAARTGKFELAYEGTLFLDEIGDMPLAMQVKLLRVLQERKLERIGGNRTIPIDIRVVAATHRDLQACIDTGSFREDLYYRLSVFPIEIPPLRDRKSDIEQIIEDLVSRFWNDKGTWIRFSSAAMEKLLEHDWPGNIRELCNLIERLIVIRPFAEIQAEDLPWPIISEPVGLLDETPAILDSTVENDAGHSLVDLPNEGLDLRQHLATVEKRLINSALVESEGVVQKAAELLGLGRTTLVEKMRRYGIEANQVQAPNGEH